MLVNLKELKVTPDDKLLERFPGYTRKVLRELKAGTYKEPRILSFDIETSPIEALVWGVWDQNVSTTQIVRDWRVICWSAKWMDKKEVLSARMTPKESLAGDDERVVRSLHKILCEFGPDDILNAHNGDRFDIKRIQGRFACYELPLPRYCSSYDTLKLCKKEFAMTFNKLDYVCQYLGLKGKMSTGGQELWNLCRLGNKEALKKMSKYCDNDVLILESLFKRLIPYIRSNPKKWGVLKRYIL